MNRALATVVFMTLVLAGGCGAYMLSLQSSFFSRFSLRELVEKNKSSAGLNCSSGKGGGGGGGGIGTGGGGIGKGQSKFFRSESFSCQIADAEQFDEAKFLQALKASIEKDLDASKATIVSSKISDATRFHLEYALDDLTGTVEISGRKGPMNFYTLNANLNEKSKDPK